MNFKLHPEVIFLKGNEGAVLYHLISGKKFQFNKTDAEAIESLNNNEQDKENIPDKLIDYLLEHDLGAYYRDGVYLEKIKTSRIATLKYDKLIPFRLNRLVIELTGTCNLKCLFCTEENVIYRSCGCKKWPAKEEMNFNEWKDIIDQSIKLGIQECFITGGEPFLKWHLLKELLNYLFKHKINVTIFTNGTLINNDIGLFLKDQNVSLALQIFSSKNKQYEKITQVDGSFERIQETFRIIDTHKIPHTVSIIVSSLDDSSFEEIQSKFGKRNYQNIYIYPTNKYYSISRIAEMMNPENREIPINLNSVPYLKKYNNCLYGQIFISSDGKIYPCMMIRDYELGDLKKEKLWEAFRRKEYKIFWEMSKTKIQHCSNCERNLFCFDCRALDYFNSKRIDGMVYCNKIEKSTVTSTN